MSNVGKIFHYRDDCEKSNGHYCIVVAEDESACKVLAVRVTSKPRRLPRAQNAVYIISPDKVKRIFPQSLYGAGNPGWHKESRIYFADAIETRADDLEFKRNSCPEEILNDIIRVIKDSYPYVVRTEYMRYFIGM